MRRLFRWVFRKSLNPPSEAREEPDALRKARSEYQVAKREQDGAIQELRRTERTLRSR